MSSSVDQSSLAAEAYTVVKRRILCGGLKLGDVVFRRQIAAELGMSFMPVTEALRRLEFEGLLESRPRVGTRVRIPSYEDVRGHYVVREALETQAAVLFAEGATEAERAELSELAVRVDALATNEDRSEFVLLHSRLHQQIADGAKCPALSELIAKSHALGSTWCCASRRPHFEDPVTWHQELAEAVSGRDPEAAAAAVRRHLALALALAVEQLEPYFQLRKAIGNTFSRRQAAFPPPAKARRVRRRAAPRHDAGLTTMSA